MAYQLTHLPNENDYRQLYINTYCSLANPIVTFDNITIKFFSDRFEHAFFESVNRKLGEKSQFSQIRAERILWIKDALQDPAADLRIGWDKNTKAYNSSSRVAVVVNNYVVVIWIKNAREAKFITAYEADNSIGKILTSPKWNGI